MAHNLYHDIPAYADDAQQLLNVVVDIPRGCSNKYEYSEEGGYFILDRVLYQPNFYPFDYGFIPQTHGGDGDAVDAVVLLTYPTFSGCVIKVRPIGIIYTSDQDGEDEKVVCVPDDKLDPRFAEIKAIDDLPAHTREELLYFFKEYKKLEKNKYDKIEIKGFGSKEDVYKVVQAAHQKYNEEKA